MKVIFLPIEPIRERYSVDWREWFLEEFLNHEIELFSIEPQLKFLNNQEDKDIAEGEFLDIFNTNIYKSAQIQQTCKLLRTFDRKEKILIFAMDLWFPSLEILAYVRDAAGFENLKITGCFHAGTWDRWDFIVQKGMKKWGKYLEYCLFRILDKAFVATEFHKELISDSINELLVEGKIEIVHFPIKELDPLKYQVSTPIEKLPIVVFPHRLAKEKNPGFAERVFNRASASVFHNTGVRWSFVQTKKEAKTKEEYYKILFKSKISFSSALQETFGIAMLESVLCDCIPIVPNSLSYKELYPDSFTYTENDLENAALKLEDAMMNQGYYQIPLMKLKTFTIQKGNESIRRMLISSFNLFNKA